VNNPERRIPIGWKINILLGPFAVIAGVIMGIYGYWGEMSYDLQHSGKVKIDHNIPQKSRYYTIPRTGVWKINVTGTHIYWATTRPTLNIKIHQNGILISDFQSLLSGYKSNRVSWLRDSGVSVL